MKKFSLCIMQIELLANMERLKHENASVKKQNKSFREENHELSVKIKSLEYLVKSILTCDHCENVFEDKNSLRDHFLSNHVETNYKCNVCESRFRTMEDL